MGNVVKSDEILKNYNISELDEISGRSYSAVLYVIATYLAISPLPSISRRWNDGLMLAKSKYATEMTTFLKINLQF